MKKQRPSKTESLIRQAVPSEVDIDPELSYLAKDLDNLEIWASFKNSDIGKEFYNQIGLKCATRLNLILKDHRKLGDSLHDYLSEVNILLSILDKMDQSEDQLPELQEEIDNRVKELIIMTQKHSNNSNAGL